MMDNTQAPPPRRVYFITHPRTASNLLVKILNLEEQNTPSSFRGGYFFRDAITTSFERGIYGKSILDWTPEDLTVIRDIYDKCFANLKAWLDEAEAHNQIAFVKEHSIFMADPVALARYIRSRNPGDERSLPESWKVGTPGQKLTKVVSASLNKTVLHDDFLLSFKPTFIVRHPALSFPSFIRAFTGGTGLPGGEEAMRGIIAEIDVWMTYSWIRSEYQFFADNAQQVVTKSANETIDSSGPQDQASYPLVVDADDIIATPEIVIEFAKHVGLDPSKLKFEWQAMTKEELEANYLANKKWKEFTSTISRSSGIRKDKSGVTLDVKAEKAKWKTEFGEILGEQLAKWVEDAMGDYEFFREKRLRPGQVCGTG